MLLQFKCKNHRSIKDEITFSMRASAEIYWANGSGKTSVLDALAKMSLIILNSNNHQPGDYIIRAPHKLSEKSEPTEFSIIFEKNNRKYSYAFSYNEQGIVMINLILLILFQSKVKIVMVD